MTFSKLTRKDFLRRTSSSKLEQRFLWLNFLIKNQFLPFEIRLSARNTLSSLYKLNSFSLLNNRCILTGNSRSVYREFSFSRMQLKSFSRIGILKGIRKSSW